MIKSGLFLCSIGLLILVFSANQNTGTYNWLNMIGGILLLIAGIAVYLRGTNNEKAMKNKNKKEVK